MGETISQQLVEQWIAYHLERNWNSGTNGKANNKYQCNEFFCPGKIEVNRITVSVSIDYKKYINVLLDTIYYY